MKLVIGNRSYSSWSLRAWLSCRQSGLPFSVEVVPLYGPEWDERKAANPALAPSGGRVPVLWHGTGADTSLVVWDSLAILEYLADVVGPERFWPRDPAARALARAMVAEMHAGFAALRRDLPMNLRRAPAPVALGEEARRDCLRIIGLWAEARARFGQGGPYLFGPFGAADIAFAPVVSRFQTYGVPLTGFAASYADALWSHAWLGEWVRDASEESWTIAQFDVPAAP